MRSLRRIARALLAAGLLLTAAAHAVTVDAVLEGWVKELKASEQDLRQGKYAAAEKVARRATRQMVEQLGPGASGGYILGIAVLQRAVAEAGLGRGSEALWHWHVAQALHPPFAKSDLGVFGQAGAFLAAHPLGASPGCAPPEACAGARLTPSPVLPPRVLRQTRPEYPTGARYFGVKGHLVVQVLIGKDGVPREPRVLEALTAPTLGYAALEALREWRFAPARLDGEPVEVTYVLTVNFAIR